MERNTVTDMDMGVMVMVTVMEMKVMVEVTRTMEAINKTMEDIKTKDIKEDLVTDGEEEATSISI